MDHTRVIVDRLLLPRKTRKARNVSVALWLLCGCSVTVTVLALMEFRLFHSLICLTAASADPLTSLSTGAGAMMLRYFLLGVGVLLVTDLAENYLCDRRGGIKLNLVFERWLIADERCSNSGSNAAKRGRYASIKYETEGTDDEFAGEDFQNKGTFIVVKSSVFSKSSAQKTHLARDAYHAYSPGT